MQSFKLKFSGVTILQGVEFPIFLLIFEWALQQCSATALPVILKISVRTAQVMQMMPKHIFWPIVVSSSLYATGVTRDQGVVLRRIGGRGHFRSRDKDGAQTIRSAIAKNSMLYANCTALSFIEPELLPIEVLHCGKREFLVFLREIVENIKKF